jgi:hypothetical protein
LNSYPRTTLNETTNVLEAVSLLFLKKKKLLCVFFFQFNPKLNILGVAKELNELFKDEQAELMIEKGTEEVENGNEQERADNVSEDEEEIFVYPKPRLEPEIRQTEETQSQDCTVIMDSVGQDKEAFEEIADSSTESEDGTDFKLFI